MIAIGRALYNDIRAGALVEGGSTITQQLARISILPRRKTVPQGRGIVHGSGNGGTFFKG